MDITVIQSLRKLGEPLPAQNKITMAMLVLNSNIVKQGGYAGL